MDSEVMKHSFVVGWNVSTIDLGVMCHRLACSIQHQCSKSTFGIELMYVTVTAKQAHR